MRNVPIFRRAGYTLVELVIVVTVLAVIAAIAVPNMSSGVDRRQYLAAEEMAAAIRYARSESIRTGQPHGFRFLPSEFRIRVFSVDASVNPWTWVWDIYHPIDKQLYDYRIPAELTGTVAPVVSSSAYRGICDRPDAVYFDVNGAPRCLEPENVLLDTYRLDIVGGSGQANVVLDGITGRVATQ